MAAHVTDFGDTLVIVITDDDDDPINISSATTKQIIWRTPGGTVVTKPVAFTTNGSDGSLSYAWVDGDRPDGEAGEWEAQAFVAGTGWQYHSEIGSFPIQRNL